MTQDLSARLRDVLRPMTQEYVWAISTHECGGKDPGVCRNCDRNAEALSLNIEKAVAPFLSSLLEEQAREIRTKTAIAESDLDHRLAKWSKANLLPGLKTLITGVQEHLNQSRARYYELLMAVGTKYPGESRHETALRYIRQAEDRDSIGALSRLASSSPPPRAEET